MTSDGVASLRWRMAAVLVCYLSTVAVTIGALGALYVVGLPAAVTVVSRMFDADPAFGIAFVVLILLFFLGAVGHLFEEVMETPLARVEAAPIYERAYGDLLDRLDELASAAGVPTPALYQVESEVPAAFSTGIRQSSATIVVTTGLLHEHNDAVIEAVLAHEIAHVAHRDAGLMYAAQLFPAVAYIVANAVYRPLLGDGGPERDSTATPRQAARGRNGRSAEIGPDNDPAPGHSLIWIRDPRAIPPAIALILVAIATWLLTGLIAIFAWAASIAVYRLLSRVREYAADERAAELLDDPAAVTRMLRRLDAGMAEASDDALTALDGGHEPLYVLGIDRSLFDANPGRLISDDLFPASHPPTADRIERLRSLDR